MPSRPLLWVLFLEHDELYAACGGTHPRNPKIKRPTQDNAGGTQPQRNNRYVDSCAATVNQVMDKILHNQGSADRGQETAAIRDASSWIEEEQRDFMKYRKEKEDLRVCFSENRHFEKVIVLYLKYFVCII